MTTNFVSTQPALAFYVQSRAASVRDIRVVRRSAWQVTTRSVVTPDDAHACSLRSNDSATKLISSCLSSSIACAAKP